MGGRGPAPKDPAQRIRKPKESRAALKAKRPLAPPYPAACETDERMRDWWLGWVTSPMTARFLGPDWSRLQALADLRVMYLAAVDARDRNGAVDLMKEIRLNESLLGATAVDRARLKWDVTTEEPEEDDGRVIQAGSRFRHLTVTDPAAERAAGRPG